MFTIKSYTRFQIGLTLGLLCSLSLAVASVDSSSSPRGNSITLTKIVVDGDPVPDAPERSFFVLGGDYSRPALDGDTVVFIAQEQPLGFPHALWAASISTGTIIRLVDRETPIPDGDGNFTELTSSIIRGGTVVFRGHGASGQAGLYSVPAEGGQVITLVNQNTPIPGGKGTFTPNGFRHYDLDGGNVVFDQSTGGVHVYTVPATGGEVRSVDNNTVICEAGDVMTNFSLPNISGETVAMLVWNPTAIYTAPLSGLVGVEDPCTFGPRLRAANATRIASRRVEVPDSGGRVFNPFSMGLAYGGADIGTGPLIDGEIVVFYGAAGDDTLDLEGLYSSYQGGLIKLVDTNTPYPGGTGNFRINVWYSLSGGRVVFFGADSDDPDNRQGLYSVPATGGPITKIIATGDSLGDDRIVAPRGLSGQAPIQGRSLSGNQLAFRVGFVNGGSGIYVATINDPE